METTRTRRALMVEEEELIQSVEQLVTLEVQSQGMRSSGSTLIPTSTTTTLARGASHLTPTPTSPPPPPLVLVLTALPHLPSLLLLDHNHHPTPSPLSSSPSPTPLRRQRAKEFNVLLPLLLHLSPSLPTTVHPSV